VVARDGDDGRTKTAQQRGRAFVLVSASAMSQIAARNDQGRLETTDEGGQGCLDVGALARADMQVGDVENARWHGRPTL
jgi:hypothetical protein